MSISRVFLFALFVSLASLATNAFGMAHKKGECEPCYKDSECATHACFQGKCIWRNRVYICFPKPSSTPTATPSPSPSPSPIYKKKDCEPCEFDYECRTGECSLRQCGYYEKVRSSCPKPACQKCKLNSQCLSGKCWGFRCTSGTYKGNLKCGFTPVCKPCSRYTECASGLCFKGLCVFNKYQKCPRKY